MTNVINYILFIGLILHSGYAISVENFYSYSHEPSDLLLQGDEQYEYVKLETKVHLYSEAYDLVYINTNGILSFRSEFSSFLNVPFPVPAVPAIAPFYSNVDTTDSANATIIYFKSHDEQLLRRANNYVRRGFSDAVDFEAKSVFVATWENVGYFNQKNDKLNSYQAVIICGEEETYVQYLYARNGLNWIQADTGESGLPDIRAQAGFLSEDGRFYLLKGSTTDDVRYLVETTNIDEPGVWLFRVGPLGFEDNIEEPDVVHAPAVDVEPTSCASGGRRKCHLHAICTDSQRGFCCSCKSGYYGNGYNCIKNDVPLRLSGTLTGSVDAESISAQVQSYVVMADGRSYTAISPLSEKIGNQLQLLQIIGGITGWLFAKPIGSTLNGYQITGGKFNHSATLQFETGEVFHVNQKFLGLNLWDQLAVEIELSGSLPIVAPHSKLHLEDFTEEFTRGSENTMKSVSNQRVSVGDEERDITFNVYQEITYEKCKYLQQTPESASGVLKTSRISLNYDAKEQALRMNMLNKIADSDKLNPCLEEYTRCGQNTICVPSGDDNYECECKNGFTIVSYSGETEIENCVDINECDSTNICDEKADCVNEPGGYSCICHYGYTGNGLSCVPIDHIDQYSYSTTDRGTTIMEETTRPQPTYSHPQYSQSTYPPTSQTNYDKYADTCPHCGPDGVCIDGKCTCEDINSCDNVCEEHYVWNGHACHPSYPEYEIDPFCNIQGCVCPQEYKLVEYAFNQVCQLIDFDSENSEKDIESCDVLNNCNPFANCEWIDNHRQYECVCNPGYDGNGYNCVEKEVSCINDDVCDVHGYCSYDEVKRKSLCICGKGFIGDGKFCQIAPECAENSDCGMHSVCDQGICICENGYERDISDFCVMAGSCGGAYCAENAQCKWDNYQKVSYCHCPEGFDGDGVRACKSIPPPCNVRSNCGLDASCIPNYREPSIYECVCNNGFYGDGFVCTPEKNCINNPELCDRNANCIVTSSGYQCICNQGFIGNGSICNEAQKIEDGFLLVSQGVATVKVPFNGKSGRPISMAQMAIGLDKDCAEGRVYWSDITAKAIYSSKYDGSDKKIFISDDIISPEGVAVDWVSRRIYWTDSAKDTIEVASIDNPKIRSVLINKYLVNPRGIVVDPHSSKLYWSDWNRESPKIEWSNLDGTERSILLSAPDVNLPNSLAISIQTGELCFADAGLQRIGCVDTYSKTARIIVANLTYPFGLAITEDQYFWTDWTTKKIEAVDSNGIRKAGIPAPLFGNHKMYGMTAVTDRCPLFYSPCMINNGDCPVGRICLANPRSPAGRSCKCVKSADCNNEIFLDD